MAEKRKDRRRTAAPSELVYMPVQNKREEKNSEGEKTSYSYVVPRAGFEYRYKHYREPYDAGKQK